MAPPTSLTPAVIMETAPKRHVPQDNVAGRLSFDVISPELEPKILLPLQEGAAETDDNGMKRGRHKGACSLPPLQGGGAALLQLKMLRQMEMEGGGARALWRTVFSGNRKEKKKRGGTLPPGAERVKRETANWIKATGDDAVKKHDSNTVMSQ